MNDRLRALAAATLLLAAFEAGATDIPFDNLAVGTTLSTQYPGVAFSPNAFSGAGAPDGNWATNTDMTVVSATGSDVGALGTPSLVSGNILRSFNAWTNENGDPSFRISFASAINSFSADFAGVDTPADVRLFAYNGDSLLATVVGSSTGQFTLSFFAPRITSVVLTPGDFFDYVAVDNIRYQAAVTAVPEPGTLALLSLGMLVLARVRRGARRH
jgi:PEP-CTERM motif